MSRYWNASRRPLFARCLHERDVAALMEFHEFRKHYGSLLEPKLQAMLEGLVGIAQSHSSYSRLIASGTTGHISGRLVPTQSALDVFESGEVSLFMDEEAAKPLTDDELRSRNRSGVGSALILTSLIWQGQDRSDDSIGVFLAHAIEHFVRWFEGNCIECFLIYYYPSTAHIIEPMFDRYWYTIVTTQYGNDAIWMKLVARNNKMVPKHIPLHAHFSNMREWPSRLLAYPSYLMEEPDQKRVLEISDARKLQGRVLYEFEFDTKSAVESCIPTWSVNRGEEGFSIPSIEKWRQDVSRDLNINPRGSTRHATMAEIQHHISLDPSLLALI